LIGCAHENQLYCDPAKVQKPWSIDDDYIEGTVYVSANGNVTSCCDMAFKRIDRESKGNVLETSLSDIIKSFSNVNEEQLAA